MSKIYKHIHTGKELLDLNITRFHVENGIWLGKIRNDNGVFIIDACVADDEHCIVRSFTFKEDTVLDYDITYDDKNIKQSDASVSKEFSKEFLRDMADLITLCEKENTKSVKIPLNISGKTITANIVFSAERSD